MTSYKNMLQEYCQKNKVGIPNYTYKIISGNDHNPLWEVELNYNNNTFKAINYNKKKADQEVAKVALEMLGIVISEPTACNNRLEPTACNNRPEPTACNNRPEPTACNNRPEPTACNRTVELNNTESKSDYIVLIDLENIQPKLKHIKDINDLHYNNNIYGFASVYTTVDVNFYKKYFNVITINSPANEAADHLMTYYASKLINDKNNKEIYVCSRDKSSSILVYILTNIEKYHVVHYTNLEDVENMLCFMNAVSLL
jgi:hypothetical protein